MNTKDTWLWEDYIKIPSGGVRLKTQHLRGQYYLALSKQISSNHNHAVDQAYLEHTGYFPMRHWATDLPEEDPEVSELMENLARVVLGLTSKVRMLTEAGQEEVDRLSRYKKRRIKSEAKRLAALEERIRSEYEVKNNEQ